MFELAVRPALQADVDQLVVLEDEARAGLVDQRGGARWLETNPPIGSRWSDLIDATDSAVLVAELDAVPVGFAASTFGRDGVARVAGVYVTPEARECGFGDHLLEDVIATARQHGCTRIEGEALPGDRHTKNLWERAGITARLIVVSAPLEDGRSVQR